MYTSFEGSIERLVLAIILSTEYKKKFTRIADLDIDIQKIVNKNPINMDVIKPITKFGSGEYLEIDVLKVIEKKDCIDE